MQRVGQRHFAVAVVVAVGFAVGGDVDQLRLAVVVREGGQQAVGELLAVVQQAVRRRRLRDRAVVEEQ